MRFSLYLNPQTPGPEHDHRIIGQLIEHAERGVELGYDSLSLTEHDFIDYNTYGNAFVLGAHLAAKLPETTLVTTVTVPPLQHPVELAEKINLLDNLTQGRFVAGLGTGGSPIEFRGFGRTPVDKEAIFFEVVDVVEALWRRRREDPPMGPLLTGFLAGATDGFAWAMLVLSAVGVLGTVLAWSAVRSVDPVGLTTPRARDVNGPRESC